MAVLRSAKVVHNIKSYHDALKKHQGIEALPTMTLLESVREWKCHYNIEKSSLF